MQNNIDLFGLGAIMPVTTGSGCDFMKKQYLEAVGIYHYPLLMPEKGGPCGEQKKKRPLRSDLFLEGSAVTDRFNGTAPLCKPDVGYHTHSRRNNAPYSLYCLHSGIARGIL